MSRETALRKLAKRTGTMELQIFVVALLVQARSGGDLVELLDNLAAMIRKRLKLKDRVRALTGEGRMQALPGSQGPGFTSKHTAVSLSAAMECQWPGAMSMPRSPC